MGTGTAAATKESMEHLLSKEKGQISILVTGGKLVQWRLELVYLDLVD